MSTLISEVIEESLAEAGYAHRESEAEMRRLIERNNRQKRLDTFLQWERERQLEKAAA